MQDPASGKCRQRRCQGIDERLLPPGVIKQTGEFNSFVFAERDSRPSTRVDALREAINAAGATAPHTDDIDQELWLKFILFSAVSGVTAAARCTMGDVRENPELSKLYQSIVAETATLARACQIDLPVDVEEKIWLARSDFRLPCGPQQLSIWSRDALETEWISARSTVCPGKRDWTRLTTRRSIRS